MMDVKRELEAARGRLERIEAQLQFLFRRLGITTRDAPAANVSPAVMDLLGRGDRKGAMRAFMEETGAGLKDAETVIESLARGNGG
jgi:hypothetical protein